MYFHGLQDEYLSCRKEHNMGVTNNQTGTRIDEVADGIYIDGGTFDGNDGTQNTEWFHVGTSGTAIFSPDKSSTANHDWVSSGVLCSCSSISAVRS